MIDAMQQPTRTVEAQARHAHGAQPSTSFYANPSVYDILHARGTAAEVDGLERVARRFSPKAMAKGARWFEPGCGSARHLRILLRRGKRISGFDHEPVMIQYAKERLRTIAGSRAATASLFVAGMDDFLEARPRLRADFAFNLINTIRHIETDRAMLAHLDSIATVLRPTGVYAVGLSLNLYGFESETEDVWSGSRGTTSVTQVVQYLPPRGEDEPSRLERVVSHMTIQQNTRTHHVDSDYVLRTYSIEQWTRLIDRSAMRIVGAVDQDGRAIEPSSLGYSVFVLAPRPREGRGESTDSIIPPRSTSRRVRPSPRRRD